MSLNEIMRNEYKPWLNCRVNDLFIDGAVNISTAVGSLQQVYDNSPAPPTIIYDDISKNITIKNNPNDDDTLFRITDNADTKDYVHLSKNINSFGDNNTFNADGAILGKNNNLNEDGFILGDDNVLDKTGTILGNSNLLNQDGQIFGNSNQINSSKSLILGNQNQNNGLRSSIIGNNNNINANYSFILGDNNRTVTPGTYILNSLSGTMITTAYPSFGSFGYNNWNLPNSGAKYTTQHVILENSMEWVDRGQFELIYSLDVFGVDNTSYNFKCDCHATVRDGTYGYKGDMFNASFDVFASKLNGVLTVKLRNLTTNTGLLYSTLPILAPIAYNASKVGDDLIRITAQAPANTDYAIITNVRRTEYKFDD